ncbi:tyrosine-type recombinase/integrase [Deinococcus sp. SDU3-2]|uniref:Tyrosine-type recombinase/integrase n=1 Tax=Deinococcus terrestris TaxID=2651870 RepID=A0A7X1TSH4_9DEIO|nr:tyrosine-type recombinase/integrase [Deinococcus terrestris]
MWRRHPFGQIFLFILQTGLRRGEACGLRWAKVVLEGDHPHIVVEESLVAIKGKLHVSPPKTTAGARVLPLSEESWKFLEEH